MIGWSLGRLIDSSIGCGTGTWEFDVFLDSEELLGLAGNGSVGDVGCWASIAEGRTLDF